VEEGRVSLVGGWWLGIREWSAYPAVVALADVAAGAVAGDAVVRVACDPAGITAAAATSATAIVSAAVSAARGGGALIVGRAGVAGVAVAA
jgi:hypothetical protein